MLKKQDDKHKIPTTNNDIEKQGTKKIYPKNKIPKTKISKTLDI